MLSSFNRGSHPESSPDVASILVMDTPIQLLPKSPLSVQTNNSYSIYATNTDSTYDTDASSSSTTTTTTTSTFKNSQPLSRQTNQNGLIFQRSPISLNQRYQHTGSKKTNGSNHFFNFNLQTKCLCAIIVALIFVILALIIFNHRVNDSGQQRQQQQLQLPSRFERIQLAQDASNNRLMASGSEHSNFQMMSPMNDPNDHPSDKLSSNNNDDGSDDDDNVNNSDYSISNNNNNHDQSLNDDHPLADKDNNNDLFIGNRDRQLVGKKLRDPDTVCLTPGCVKAAAQILNNMDNRTEPCDDFYQFACGHWIQTQVIPDEKATLSVFSQITADLNVKLRALIERKPHDNDPPIVGQMRNMFASCMNLSDIETKGDEPLLNVINDLGGWPVLNIKTIGNSRAKRTTAAYDISWLEIITKFRDRGFSHDTIIDLSVVTDVRNSNRYIVELDQSSLGLPERSYYFKGMNDTTVAAYYNMMIESAVMLGAPRPEARRQMAEAFEFEASLARISLPRDQRRNVTRLYNKMLAIDLYKLAPNIDWRRYLNALLRDDQFDLDKDEVLVKVPSFIRALDNLLLKTEPRIVANYMIWRIIRHSMNSLSRKWRELAHGYSTVTTGRQIEEPRWEQCLNSLEGTLNAAISAFYVKNHFNEQSKASALEMVDYIKNEFTRILDEIDWMDEETREEAKLKAKSISHFIGYPDELLKDEFIEDYYKGIVLSRDNFYQNTRYLRIWSTNYAFSQLRKANKRGDWKKHSRAAVVNAFYNPIENSIEFPAGILQGAFFDAERPNYLNFGAIGYVIGHEITHGFDDRGRQFDKDGNNRNWWKPKTDARFRERAQCIIEQYGNYTVKETGLKVNGLTTQGENIADNGGIKQAFRSYKRWTKDHGREPRLPGLNYTPDQLFWISAANIWCGKFRPEVLKLRLQSGVHSPSQFRVIGPLSNAPEFAKSFNCPIGSTMNPEKKCSVW